MQVPPLKLFKLNSFQDHNWCILKLITRYTHEPHSKTCLCGNWEELQDVVSLARNNIIIICLKSQKYYLYADLSFFNYCLFSLLLKELDVNTKSYAIIPHKIKVKTTLCCFQSENVRFMEELKILYEETQEFICMTHDKLQNKQKIWAYRP